MLDAIRRQQDPGQQREQQQQDGELFDAIDSEEPQQQRPADVELLFDRDTPQRSRNRERNSVRGTHPVTGEKRERDDVDQPEAIGWKDRGDDEYSERKEREIQRPDAQRAPHVERGNAERAAACVLAE